MPLFVSNLIGFLCAWSLLPLIKVSHEFDVYRSYIIFIEERINCKFWCDHAKSVVNAGNEMVRIIYFVFLFLS